MRSEDGVRCKPATASVRSRIELGTQRERLLQVLDEEANLGGHPAAGGPHGKDWHCSFKRSQEAENCTFSEFSGL
jgi:hypothetical protein